MIEYKGSHCPVCHKPFTERDDIVVCPDCGTPYHRDCWKKAGGCVNADRHGTDFVWQPERSPETAEVEAICPNCGTHNPPGAQFCNHCGVPLQPAGKDHAGAAPATPLYARGNAGNGGSAAGSANSGAAPGFGNTMQFRREIGPDDMIDGIKARDWASFVGRSSLYYLLQFVRLSETRRKVAVSFSAFFFGPFYFFYRKMWKEGVLFALLDLVLTVPTFLYLLMLSGATITSGLNSTALLTAINVCYVINWAQMVLRSLFAVYWYKRGAERRIHEVYEHETDEERRADALALRGGTSFAAVILYAGLGVLGGVLLYSLMGPNLSAVLTALYR